MAIVIRTAYNNKDWKAPCDAPGKDPLCFYCFKGLLRIHEPDRSDIVCSGHCWEEHLCNDYKWGCPPRGRFFGPNAYPGAAVFLVFKQPDNNYTIWGKTVISSVDEETMQSDKDYENGFSFIHLDSFDPLPRDKWVNNIPDKQLVGAKWLMGRHRYIDANQEKYLDKLIAGEVPEEMAETAAIAQTGNGVDITITLMPNIYEKLKGIAAEEGRRIDEIMREAIAKWLKER